MALRHLAKWGAEALKPQFVGGNWHKPLISARTAAELKKRFRAEGREWPVPEKPRDRSKFGFGLGNKKFKGHKHDKLAIERQKTIQERLKEMPAMIAAYRESKKLKDVSIIDKMFMTTKQQRQKYLSQVQNQRGSRKK